MSSKVTPIRPTAADNDHDGLIARFKTRALEQITGLLDGMFDGADDALFHMSEQADNNFDQGQYFDAMRALRLERADVTGTFVEQLGKAISDGLDSEPAEHGEDMGLLPAEALEENIAVANIISRADSRLRNELAPLHTRLQTLSEKYPGQITASCVAPGNLCHCFRQAMAPVDLDIEIKLLVYKLFERSVMTGLGKAYRELDALLEKNNVAAKTHTSGDPREPGGPRRRHGQAWAQRLAELRGEVASENRFGIAEVLAGLDRLQSADRSYDPDPAELIDLLHELLRTTQGDNLPRSLKREQRRLIGMVTAMFNQLLGETGLTQGTRALLSQLRLPVMKTALIDPSFFRDADHPARRLVNDVGTLDSVAVADPSVLHAQAQTLIERLLAEFERDPGVLETVADELHHLSAGAGDAALSAQQRQALVARAKRIAVLELRQQALGRSLPEAIKTFLLKGWGPLMAYRYLQHDLDSPQWRHIGAMLTRILDAVQPPPEESERDALRREQAELAAFVRAELNSLAIGRARLNELMESLDRAFGQALTAPAHPAPESDADLLAQLAEWSPEETVFDDNGSHEASNTAFEQLLSRAEEPAAPPQAAEVSESQSLDAKTEAFLQTACRPGTWFQIYTGANHPRWLKVAAYNRELKVVTFANREGEPALERDALLFAQDLRAGRSQPIYERDAFEQKLAKIIDPNLGESDRS